VISLKIASYLNRKRGHIALSAGLSPVSTQPGKRDLARAVGRTKDREKVADFLSLIRGFLPIRGSFSPGNITTDKEDGTDNNPFHPLYPLSYSVQPFQYSHDRLLEKVCQKFT
jgi:hypothetical protein